MVDVIAIVSTFRRRKIAACLIIFEVAIALAILSNALFLMHDRVERVTMRSGTAEAEIVDFFVGATPESHTQNAMADTRKDLRALAAVAGVSGASAINQLPFERGESKVGIQLRPDQQEPTLNAALYMGDQSVLEVLGVRLIAGRRFRAEELLKFERGITPPSAILTRAASEKLFGSGGAVGRTIYLGNSKPVTVIGVVEALVRPNLPPGRTTEQAYSAIVPVQLSYVPWTHYVVRTSRADMPRVIRDAKKVLERSDAALQLIWARPLVDLKMEYFQQERSMTWILVGVCLALLIVTAAGIFGLTSVWMRERVHQIGIRRALGATRLQILMYYSFESFPLAITGVAAGGVVAFAAGDWLFLHGYSLTRLPLVYAVFGAVGLLVLNQLAVFTPARRAATISPAEATRL